MLNLIKAEFYKAANRPYFYILTASISLVILAINLMVYSTPVPVTTYFMLTMGIESLGVPVFFVLMFVDIVLSDEIKEQTLKNTVAFGISRTRVYISKVVTSTILAFIGAIVILGVFTCCAFLLFPAGDKLTPEFLNSFALRILCAVPLYMGATSICVLLGFILKKNTAFAFSYAGLFVVVNQALFLLSVFVSDKFMLVHNILITTNLNSLSSQDITGTGMAAAAAVGFAYTIIFIVMGIMVFKKQEVK